MEKVPVIYLNSANVVTGDWDMVVQQLHACEGVDAEVMLLDTLHNDQYFQVAVKIDGTIYVLGEGEVYE